MRVMNPCPECGGKKTLEVNTATPEHLDLWEEHKHGCSWSPLVTPARHRWCMRSVPRTDGVPDSTSALPKDKP